MIKNDHGVVRYPTLDLDLIEKWQKMNLNKPDPADLMWVKMDNRSVVGCDFVLDEKVDLSLLNIFSPLSLNPLSPAIFSLVSR